MQSQNQRAGSLHNCLAKPIAILSIGLLLFSSVVLSSAQNPITNNSARGVVRLKVKVRIEEASKGLARKRFYLVRGSLEQNHAWLETVRQQPLQSRDCYYRSAGASERLIGWLKKNDCESVYCRELSIKDVDGPDAVPEFQHAASLGQAEFHSPETARRWATVNLPANIRDGFYRANQQRLASFIREAESVSGATVLSVMTDRNGTAYFTELPPATYVLSNILPAEIDGNAVTWACEVQVKPGDLFSEKPYLISNRNDRNVKCVGVERPLPVCEAAK